MLTLRELALLAKQTREAQRRYFSTRAQGDLEESKRLERTLDAAVDEVLAPGLFGAEATGQQKT